MEKNDIMKLFNRFAGKEIKRSEGRCDPVIQSMNNLADKNDVNLRIIFPGTMVTGDYRHDRLNFQIAEQGGKYVLGRPYFG